MNNLGTQSENMSQGIVEYKGRSGSGGAGSDHQDAHATRLCIFAHYDPEGVLDEYVVKLLVALREVCSTLVFVSTSPNLSPSAVAPHADQFIARNGQVLPTSSGFIFPVVGVNFAYDFASWKAGLEATANWRDYDEVVLCNDSVYGPLSPLSDAFRAMDQVDCDFWGITECLEVKRHIESYYLVFRKPVIASHVFADFWRDLQPVEDKRRLIARCEIEMSQTLIGHGFRPAALFRDDLPVRMHAATLAAGHRLKQLMHQPAKLLQPNWASCGAYRFNKAHYFWKHLIRQYMPFLKVDLMRFDTMGVGERAVLERVRAASDYPVELIARHLERTRRYYDASGTRHGARPPLSKRLYWSLRALPRELRDRRSKARATRVR
jgi:lipopolysaccharide biosynthesis protein